LSERWDVRRFDEVWRRKAATADDAYRPGHNRRVDAALRLLRPGRRLLDVGCGAGVLAAQARDRFAEVHGIDIAERAVAIAQGRGVNALVVNLNLEPLPHADAFFDVVTALSSLQYVVDVDAVLAECARVLRPGGRFLVGVPNMRALWRLWTLGIRGLFPRTSLDDVGHDGGTLHYFTHRSLVRRLRGHGFVPGTSHGVFCIPRAVEGWPDGGALGGLKREFLSAETIVDAVKP
jgi:SAM-dependent methyltransferase